MKSLFILILLLCLFEYSNAQELDYTNYYKSTNLSEINIANEKYEEAIKIYDKLFESYEPFYGDLYNCILCSMIINDTSKVLDYTERFIKLGGNIKVFEKITEFNEITKTNNWINLKEKALLRKSDRSSDRQKEFLLFIKELSAKEQEKAGDMLAFYKVVYENTKTIYNIFSSDTNKLELISISKYDNNYSILMNHYYELFLHKKNANKYSGEERTFFLNTELEKYNLDSLHIIAVKKGYLNAEKYLFSYLYKEGRAAGVGLTVFAFRDSNDFVWVLPSKEDVVFINNIRSKLGLSSFEDNAYKFIKTNGKSSLFKFEDYKKMIYELENDSNIYNLPPEEHKMAFLNIELIVPKKNKSQKAKDNFVMASIGYTSIVDGPRSINSKNEDNIFDKIIENAKKEGLIFYDIDMQVYDSNYK